MAESTADGCLAAVVGQEIGQVEDVQGLGAKFQVKALGDFGLFDQAEIEMTLPRKIDVRPHADRAGRSGTDVLGVGIDLGLRQSADVERSLSVGDNALGQIVDLADTVGVGEFVVADHALQIGERHVVEYDAVGVLVERAIAGEAGGCVGWIQEQRRAGLEANVAGELPTFERFSGKAVLHVLEGVATIPRTRLSAGV